MGDPPITNSVSLGKGSEFGRGLKDGHHQGGKGYSGLYVAAGFAVREEGE